MTPTPAFGVLLVGDPLLGGAFGALGVVVPDVDGDALGAAIVKCGLSFVISCGFGW